MIFRQQSTLGELGLPHDFMLLFQLLLEQLHKGWAGIGVRNNFAESYALTTLPDLMHPVQTRIRLLVVFTFALTV